MRYVVPTSSRTMVRPRTIRYKRRPKRYVVRRKKVYRRKYNRYNLTSSMTLVPLRKFVKMRYVERIDLSAAAGVVGAYQWQTSIYDPNKTGGGHQPYMRDQWATFYSFYRVWGMRYTIRVVQTATSNNGVTRFIISHLAYVDTLSVDQNTNEERPTCKHKARLDTYNDTTATFYGYVSVPRVEGITKKEFMGDASYEAGIGSDPTKTSKLDVSIWNNNASGGTVMVFATIDYVVELWGRVNQSGS